MGRFVYILVACYGAVLLLAVAAWAGPNRAHGQVPVTRIDNLPALDVRSVATDPQAPDMLWVASTGGLYRYDTDQGTWRVYTTADGLPTFALRSVGFGASGTAYVGTVEAGVVRFEEASQQAVVFAVPEVVGDVAQAIAVGPASVWVGSERGLSQLDAASGSVVRQWTAADGLGADRVNDLAHRDGVLWAATGRVVAGGPGGLGAGGGLSRLSVATGTLETLRASAGDSSHVYQVAVAGGTVWTGGLRGLFRADAEAGRLDAVPAVDGLVVDLLTDGSALWVVQIKNLQEELLRFDPVTETVTARLALPVSSSAASLAATEEALYVGRGARLYRVDREALLLEPVDVPLLPSRFLATAAASGSSVVLGADSLLIPVDRRTRRVMPAATLPASRVRDVAATGEALWVGTDAGAYRLGVAALAIEASGLVGDDVRRLASGPAGGVWALANGEVRHLGVDGTVEAVSLRDASGTAVEPFAEAIAGAGPVWVAASTGAGVPKNDLALVRVDPATLSATGVAFEQDLGLDYIDAVAVVDSVVIVGGDQIVVLDAGTGAEVQRYEHPARVLATRGPEIWAAFGSVVDPRAGVAVFDRSTGAHLGTLRQRDGLAHPYVTDFWVAPDGSEIWMTTYAGLTIAELQQPVGTDAPDAPSRGLRLAVAPQPVGAQATVHLHLPTAGVVRIEVFDPRGRLRGALLDRWLAAGTHRIPWHADDLPAGLYVLRAHTPAGAVARSAIHVRSR